jgi:hypothetical protein
MNPEILSFETIASEPRAFTWLVPLVRKEVRLQRNAIALGFILTLLQIAALLFCLRLPLTDRAEIDTYFTFPLWLHVILIPLMVGASAVAEEEKVGSRGWNLTFPVSKRAQWCVKLFVAIALTGLLGVGLVGCWCLVGTHFWPWSQEFGGFTLLTCSMNGSSFLPLAISECIGMFVAFHISSTASDSFRAFLVAAGIGAGIAVCLTWVDPFYAGVYIFENKMGQTQPIESSAGAVVSAIAWSLKLVSWPKVAYGFGILAAALITVILVCSFRSYRTLDCSSGRAWTGAITMFLPALAVFWLVFALFGGIEERKVRNEAEQWRIEQQLPNVLKQKADNKI